MQFSLSLAQFNVKLGNPIHNYHIVKKMTQEAVEEGSQLILFPELWSTGYDLENWRNHADPLGEGMFQRISDLAAKHSIYIGGSLLESYQEKAANTFVLFNSQGEIAALYRKIHLFRLMDEHQWLLPGNQLTLCEINMLDSDTTLKIGLAICYDLRFPEMFRKYALMGADLILLPAEWPSVRSDHWRTLVKARAIENQLYMAAVNRIGSSKNEQFGGGSAIISPWGEILVEAGELEELHTITIDIDLVKLARSRIPVLEDRRPEIYHLS